MIKKLLSLIILSFFLYGCSDSDVQIEDNSAMNSQTDQSLENNDEEIEEFRGMLDELIHSDEE